MFDSLTNGIVLLITAIDTGRLFLLALLCLTLFHVIKRGRIQATHDLGKVLRRFTLNLLLFVT